MAVKKSKQPPRLTELIDKIKARSAQVGVIGLGYVGLPLSMELARVGFKVTGFDVSKPLIKRLNAGKSDIDDVPDSIVKEMVSSGYFRATDEARELSKMDTISGRKSMIGI